MIFNEINSILFVFSKQNRQQYELNFDIVTTDFELALINSVKNNMMNLMQKGCYFHFLQVLWRYASKVGLRKENMVPATREIIMALSLLCFLRKSNIEKCFMVIKNHYINLYEEEPVKIFFFLILRILGLKEILIRIYGIILKMIKVFNLTIFKKQTTVLSHFIISYPFYYIE